jgi:hypothetical protein
LKLKYEEKMKNFIIFFLSFIAIASIVNSAIPVIDYTAIAREAYYFGQELKQWGKYLTNFDILIKKFFFRYLNYLESVKGFFKIEIDIIFKNIFKTKFLLQSPYWADIFKIDIWFNIWYKRETILQMFPSLNENTLETNNILYKKNNVWRSFVDKNIEVKKNYIIDTENYLNFLSELREYGAKQKENFDAYFNYLKQYSTAMSETDEEKVSAQMAKVIFLAARMKYDSMMINLQIMALMRSFIERQIKSEIYHSDYKQRRMKINFDTVKDIELLKEIRK